MVDDVVLLVVVVGLTKVELVLLVVVVVVVGVTKVVGVVEVLTRVGWAKAG